MQFFLVSKSKIGSLDAINSTETKSIPSFTKTYQNRMHIRKIRHNDIVIHNAMRKLHVIYQTMSSPLPSFRFRSDRVTVVPKNTSSSMRGNAFAVADDVEEASRPVHSQVVHLLGTIHLDQSYLHSPKRRLSNGEKLGPPLSNAAGPNP